MAVILWSEEQGELYSRVRSERRVFLSAEEHREEAEDLDARLDELLDDALKLVEVYAREAGYGKPNSILKPWALGRAIARSAVLAHEAMLGERRELLWEALAHKCWYGVRADASREFRWRGLRNTTKRGERRVNPEKSRGNNFRYEDFEIGLWLADQEWDEASSIFGGTIGNAIEIYRRPTLNSHDLREAVFQWWIKQSEKVLAVIRSPSGQMSKKRGGDFTIIAKALVQRFPARGPGSARLPQHYPPEELQAIVDEVLDAARDAHFPDSRHE